MRNCPCHKAGCLEVNVQYQIYPYFLNVAFGVVAYPLLYLQLSFVLTYFEDVENYICLKAKGKYQK